MWFLLERFLLPLGASVGLRDFIMALPESSIYFLRKSLEIQSFQTYYKPFQESRVFFGHYAADCMPSF